MTKRAAVVLLLLFTAAAVFAQTPPLNPTVKVMPRPATPVPPECEEGFAPQPAPRVRIEDIPAPQPVQRDLQPPRTADLREQLAEVQRAVERNDRAAFNEWLAIARSTLASYPSGAEKTRAESAIAVYDDIDRLWDYQFASPAGSFFDGSVQDGSLVERMRRYPGYEEFIRDQTIVDAHGTRIYPTKETRDFLAQIAAGRRPAPVRAARVVMPEPAPVPAPQPSAETPRTTTRRRPTRIELHTATTEPAKPKPAVRKSTKPAAVKTAPPKVAVTKPASADEVPIPSGVVSAPATTGTTGATGTETVATSATMATTATESAPTETATAVPTEATAPESTTATQPAPQKPQPKRSLIWPVVLIVIGVGVLYLLFRASA